MMKIKKILLLCSVAVSLSACGGDPLIEAPPSPVVSNTSTLTPGAYKLTFSAISTARLVTSISGVEVAVKLPDGLSISTLSGGSGRITPASILTGSDIEAGSLAFGNYSASTRTAYLSMATTQDNYRGGQYLNLLFTVSPGTSVRPDDIFALNLTFPKYKVVGFDVATHSTIVMNSSVKTLMGVER
jgi:hypothetical protein